MHIATSAWVVGKNWMLGLLRYLETPINNTKKGHLFILVLNGMVGFQVAAILQSPGEWMMTPTEKEKCDSDETEPRGDPEMATAYLKHLLPVFCSTYQSTMIPSVR
jgi:hypothetical protein